MRDGKNTGTQKYTEPSKGESNGKWVDRMWFRNRVNVVRARGLHETVWWYDTCRYREANGGLFTADQNLGKDKIGYTSAARTRQNNNGNRHGYECPEERDYFPYWVPTYQTE
eukprot:sb/3477038/